MPWPIYSSTFVRSAVVDSSATYTVPAGYRAVVKSATAQKLSGTSGHIEVHVGGYLIWLLFFQAAYENRVLNTMAVAYAGETIRGLQFVELAHLTVSGFLLREPIGKLSGPPELDVRTLERSQVLPVAA